VNNTVLYSKNVIRVGVLSVLIEECVEAVEILAVEQLDFRDRVWDWPPPKTARTEAK
jgi:hypothetical protein